MLVRSVYSARGCGGVVSEGVSAVAAHSVRLLFGVERSEGTSAGSAQRVSSVGELVFVMVIVV